MFEKDVSPFLETIKQELSPPKNLHGQHQGNKGQLEPEDDPPHDVLDWLLMEHFHTALLQRVAGLGQTTKKLKG